MHILSTLISVFVLSLCAYAGDDPSARDTRVRFPLLFTENAGQWDGQIPYGTLTPAGGIAFTRDGFTMRTEHRANDRTLRLPGEQPLPESDGIERDEWSLEFAHPSSLMRIAAAGKAAAVSNFYHGNDSTAWRSQVANYRTLRYANVWDGVDAEYSDAGGLLRQTFVVKPGADISDIGVRVKSRDQADGESRLTNVRAFTVHGNDTVLVPVSLSIKKDGTVGFKTGGGSANGTTYLSTEFMTYFGGTQGEYGDAVLLDNAGRIHITGLTYSWDLPVKNAFQGTEKGYADAFLAKFEGDGRTLLYSTYYGGTGMESCGRPWGELAGGVLSAGITHMVIGRNNSVYLAGHTDSRDLPVTANAIEKNSMNRAPYLTKFSELGALLYASYFDTNRTVYTWHDVPVLGLSADGTLLATGATWRPYDRMPPGGFQSARKADSSSYPSITPYILRFTENCDTVLFGTYFGGYNAFTGQQAITSLATDSQGYIIVAGVTSIRDLPVKNAVCDTLGGIFDLFVAKFDPTLRSLVFSTYLGGKGEEWTGQLWVGAGSSLWSWNACWRGYDDWTYFGSGNSNSLAIDRDDNVLVTGLTTSIDFPVRNAFRAALDTTEYPYFSYAGIPYYPYADITLSKLAPDGSLLTSTYVGGAACEAMPSVFIAPCGSVVLSGFTASRDYPLLGQVDTAHAGLFVSVFDPSCSTLRHSSMLIPRRPRNLTSEFSWASGIRYASGTILLLGNGSRDTATYNAFQGRPAGDDMMLRRMYFPICDESFLRCSLQLPDTIRLDPRFGFALPDTFNITLDIENSDPSRTANRLEGVLELPPGLLLDPPTQLLEFPKNISSIPPGGKVRLVWHVRVDASLCSGGSLTVAFPFRYGNAADHYAFPLLALACSQDIVLFTDPNPPPETTCTFMGPDSLSAKYAEAALEPNPWTLGYSLKNTSKQSISISRILLTLPKGMGVVTVSANDLTRPAIVLAAGQTYTTSWQLQAKVLPDARTASLTVMTFDAIGMPIDACVKTVFIPALSMSRCSTRGPASVRYNPATGSTTPDPLEVSVTLENTLDTLQNYRRMDIDLRAAPHLALAAGETVSKVPLSITNRFRRVLAWRLNVPGPVPQAVVDTVLFWYQSKTDTAASACMLEVPIVPMTTEVSCSILSPDSLALRADSLAPNPFSVLCIVRNIGNADADLSSAELSAGGTSAVAILPPQRVTLRTLAPGAADTASWSVSALVLHDAHAVGFTVDVLDGKGAPAAVCAASVFIPGMSDDLSCTLEAPDTIRYDVASDTHVPDPFQVSLTLGNRLDVAQDSIETLIDFSAAPHLKLAAGETPDKAIPSIPLRGNAVISWTVDVASTPPVRIIEPITVRFRHQADTVWRDCERAVAIEGGERIARAACAAHGHDSIWVDARYEKIIPLPVQVQYTLSNTGTIALDACEAAIVHSPMYALVNPADSIQRYGTILPGSSISREWLLQVNMDRVHAGSETISWSRRCAGMPADTSCSHAIALVPAAPDGIVFTPWLLRFRAVQNGALPPAQQVQVWTGRGASVFWQLQTPASWLDFQPANGNATGSIDFRPTTTVLPIGVHSAAVSFSSPKPVSPKTIEAVYELEAATRTEWTPLPGATALEANYPNPASGLTTIRYAIAAPSLVDLSLSDVLGRRVATLLHAPCEAGSGSVLFDASALPAGIYMYTLTVNGIPSARAMIVR